MYLEKEGKVLIAACHALTLPRLLKRRQTKTCMFLSKTNGIVSPKRTRNTRGQSLCITYHYRDRESALGIVFEAQSEQT